MIINHTLNKRLLQKKINKYWPLVIEDISVENLPQKNPKQLANKYYNGDRIIAAKFQRLKNKSIELSKH